MWRLCVSAIPRTSWGQSNIRVGIMPDEATHSNTLSLSRQYSHNRSSRCRYHQWILLRAQTCRENKSPLIDTRQESVVGRFICSRARECGKRDTTSPGSCEKTRKRIAFNIKLPRISLYNRADCSWGPNTRQLTRQEKPFIVSRLGCRMQGGAAADQGIQPARAPRSV